MGVDLTVYKGEERNWRFRLVGSFDACSQSKLFVVPPNGLGATLMVPKLTQIGRVQLDSVLSDNVRSMFIRSLDDGEGTLSLGDQFVTLDNFGLHDQRAASGVQDLGDA